MPVHRVRVEDDESPAQALERGVLAVEADNQHVVSVQATGSEWVLITGRKAGRPKETRVTDLPRRPDPGIRDVKRETR